MERSPQTVIPAKQAVSKLHVAGEIGADAPNGGAKTPTRHSRECGNPGAAVGAGRTYEEAAMRFVIARELLSLWAVTRAVLCLSVFFALLPPASTLAAEPGIQLDGPRVQGGMVRGRVAPGSAVQFEGEPVRVSKDGWFLIGFGRDAPPKAVLSVVFSGRPAPALRLGGEVPRVPHPAHRRPAPGQGDATQQGRPRAHPQGGCHG